MNVVREVPGPWPGEVDGERSEAAGCDSLLIPHNYPCMMHQRNLPSLVYALYVYLFFAKPKAKPEPTSTILRKHRRTVFETR